MSLFLFCNRLHCAFVVVEASRLDDDDLDEPEMKMERKSSLILNRKCACPLGDEAVKRQMRVCELVYLVIHYNLSMLRSIHSLRFVFIAVRLLSYSLISH